MDELQSNLQEILDEKIEKVIPENIKSGVTIFDVTGTLEEGVGGTGTILDVTDNSDISIEDNILVISIDEKTDFESNYQEVLYIQSTGTQYIDTGYYSSTATHIKLKVNVPTPSEEKELFGTYSSSDSSYRFMLARWKDGEFNLYHKANNDYKYSANKNLSSFIIEIKQGNYFKVYDFDDNILSNISIGAGGNSGYTMPLFGRKINSATSVTNLISMSLYYCQIYDGDTLVRDFVPCYRKSDNVIGLYDKVNSQFYTNAGSGTFSKGDDV